MVEKYILHYHLQCNAKLLLNCSHSQDGLHVDIELMFSSGRTSFSAAMRHHSPGISTSSFVSEKQEPIESLLTRYFIHFCFHDFNSALKFILFSFTLISLNFLLVSHCQTLKTTLCQAYHFLLFFCLFLCNFYFLHNSSDDDMSGRGGYHVVRGTKIEEF